MKGTKVIKIVLAFIAAAFLIRQGIAFFHKPISTETVTYYTVSDGLRFTAMIVRNETPVTAGDGVLHFLVSDGNHVAKDGVIANLYDSESTSVTLTKISELNKKISELEELLSYNDLEAADMDLVNAKVNEALDRMIYNGAAGDYNDYGNYSEELLSALNKRQAVKGETESFQTRLANLKEERDALSSQLPKEKGKVTTGQSGYFVSKTDGYEALLTCDQPEKLTPEYLDNLTPEEPAANAIGKIVSDYEWYIAARVTISESVNYKEGEELTMTTGVKSYPKLTVTVKKINVSEDSSEAVILFSANEMNGELAALRTCTMTAVKKEYSGLRVPSSALRFSDSVKGVYVVSGMQAKFVPINILYSNETYMICEQQSTEDVSLRLYDEVIVKGKNLYDGKVISS